MTEPTYRRVDGVVWRSGPDRIVLRRVGQGSGEEICELFGGAALVWIALDEVGSWSDVQMRLDDVDVTADIDDSVGLLLDRGLIIEVPDGQATS